MEEEKKMSIQEAYQAMLYFLENYYNTTSSIDLTDILSAGNLIGKGRTFDSAFWDYWIKAIEDLDRYKNNNSLNK